MLHTLTQQIDPILKQEAETIFKKFGLSPTQAITLFYQQVQLHQCLPFEREKIPNDITIEALNDAKAGKGIRVETTDELYRDLGIK